MMSPDTDPSSPTRRLDGQRRINPSRASRAVRPSAFPLEERLLLAVGDLDPAFGVDGKTTVPIGGSQLASAVAVQADGKIIVAGNATREGTSDFDFAVMRLNPDGLPDPGFDGDGKLLIDLGGTTETVFAVAIRPDGRIVLAGSTRKIETNDSDFAVVCLNPDGSLVTTFNGSGKTTIAFDLAGANSEEVLSDVAIQADGKIVVVGTARRIGTPFAGDQVFAAARLNEDGSLDSSFDFDGKRTVAFDYGNARPASASGVAIQADGKIVVVGSVWTGAVGDSDFAVARLNTDGSLDPIFDFDGRQTLGFDLGGNASDSANDVAIQADGRIVLAGRATKSGTPARGDGDFAVARLDIYGVLDPSFDGDGKQTIAFATRFDPLNDQAKALVIQPNGRIVLVGDSHSVQPIPITYEEYPSIVRLNPDGAVDTSFGGGPRIIDLNAGNQAFRAVALQADGKIVVAAQAGFRGFTALRFLGDVPPPPKDTTPPQALGAVLLRVGKGRTRLVRQVVVIFSEALTVANAQNTKFYRLAEARGHGRSIKDSIVPLKSAVYSAGSNLVTLTPTRSKHFAKGGRLTITTGITDTAGNPLDGNDDGTPGPAAVLTVR